MLQVSVDLQPIYELELQLGNQVVRVDSPAGSNCPLCVVFRGPLHFDIIRGRLTLSESVSYWKNLDTHYPLEEGFRSALTQHALSGPLTP